VDESAILSSVAQQALEHRLFTAQKFYEYFTCHEDLAFRDLPEHQKEYWTDLFARTMAEISGNKQG
jgi:hypothetical protein